MSYGDKEDSLSTCPMNLTSPESTYGFVVNHSQRNILAILVNSRSSCLSEGYNAVVAIIAGRTGSRVDGISQRLELPLNYLISYIASLLIEVSTQLAGGLTYP